MAYGIQNKQTKKWVEVVRKHEDGTTWCQCADRETGGIWLKTRQDALQFMKDNNIDDEYYRIYPYRLDMNEVWFKRNEEALLKVGYKKKGRKVFRPDGSQLY